MDPKRWEVVTEVFGAVVDQPLNQRVEMLASLAAGDAELRREVERLLAADERVTGGKFLEPTLPNLAVADPPTPEADVVNWRIGRYLVERRIGQGGMGEVYLAARAEDYRQHVAIKVIRCGVHADQLVRRFRDELQILAALCQHPNIASLLDAGTCDDGRPYYVMEYVAGERIDCYCDSHRLTMRQRVELFRHVCSAVQFAHQHGIIHRDLKPSNILVTADGAPKLIDFGIAKLTTSEPDDEDRGTGDRGTGDVRGAAAPPSITQQFALTPDYASPEQARGAAVTTAGDVYSLGVVLYELLAGRRPYDLDMRTPLDTHGAICERSPTPPSTAVRPETRPRDGTATLQSGDGPPTNLDAIAAARQTPPAKLQRQLAGDLDAIVLTALQKEPDQRYASVEQFSDDLRRYLDGLSVHARRESRAYRVRKFVSRYRVALATGLLLLASLTAAVVGTTRGLIVAREANVKSQRSLSQALDAVRRMLTRVGSERLAHVPQTGPMRRELLEDALGFCEAFVADHADNPEVQSELGRAYYLLGTINRELGRHQESRAAFDRAIEVLDDLSRRESHDVRDLANKELALAYYHAATGRREMGQFAESAQMLRQAIEIQSDLLQHSPSDLDCLEPLVQTLNNLSVVQIDLNQLDAAQATLDEVLHQLPPLEAAEQSAYQETAAFSHNDHGFLLRRRKKYAAAEQAYEQARRLRKSLAERFPQQPSYRKELAFSCNNLGVLYGEMGQMEKGLAAYEEGIALQRQLADDFPSYPVYRQELARTLANAAMQYRELGRTAESHASYDDALKLQAALAKEHPDVPAYREEQARTLCHLADLFATQGERRQANELRDQAFEVDPRNPTVRVFRGKSLANAEEWEQAVAEFTVALQSQPGQADIHDRRGSALRALGKHADAVSDFSRAIQLAPDDASYYRHRGSVLRDLGRLREAIADYDRAVSRLPDYDNAINSRGLAYAQLREYDRAVADFTKVLELGPDDDVTVLMNRARTHASRRDWPAAIADYKRILDDHGDHASAWHELAIAHLCGEDYGSYRVACGKLLDLARDTAEHRSLAVWTAVIVSRPPVDSTDLLARIPDWFGGDNAASTPATPKNNVIVGAVWLRAGNTDEAAKALALASMAYANQAPRVRDVMRINCRILSVMAKSMPGNSPQTETELANAAAELHDAIAPLAGAVNADSVIDISRWAEWEICGRLLAEAKRSRQTSEVKSLK